MREKPKLPWSHQEVRDAKVMDGMEREVISREQSQSNGLAMWTSTNKYIGERSTCSLRGSHHVTLCVTNSRQEA
jgi:hypothetical protein